MVQSKKQVSNKPKFAEVIIGDKDATEMYEATSSRPRRNPYLKLNSLLILGEKWYDETSSYSH